MTQPVLELLDGSVAYDGRTAVAEVDLVVEAGEVVAVLGANGSGKSTVVRACVGLLPLTTGTLALFGTPRDRFREWTRLGYVPQRGGATTGVPATVREVVATGRLARSGLRRRSAEDRRAVETALETVGLAERARDSVGTLSGGQQQRVLIARALTCEPELLVLDEPTAGVDLASQTALADTLRTLVGRGTTVVLVAHELGPMHPLITRAVTMSEGRVLHDGPPPEPDHLHLHDPEHAHPVHEVRDTTAPAWGLR
ncbi:MAG: Zinc ABC transporter, ATP-binding protein ZnuC [uncultured Frankineae bacterium]|uniref:Zinc ABC transporter, ATP-binding protein ZnuC n=1 Tax=uncultured Frankineae bacterium TaxID=437475 RepID=A0A6J4LDA2_9ACTN|nr:MAG: Zinc ABC transporter, ATP-binding protein ZnuC [uncultured Frankineae bacterium]